MQINPTIDLTGVPAASQAGFTAAVNAACNFYDLLFTNNVTLNITFNYGTEPATAVASNTPQGNYTTYSAVQSALLANANTPDALTAANTLPNADPTNGGPFYATEALFKAWGLTYVPPRGTTGAQDGTVTLSNSVPWDFGTSRGAPNDHDSVGALEHEISEVMGRIGVEGTANVGYNNNTHTALDLFRYTTVNGVVTRVLAPGPGSFSFDGKTLLQTYNDPTILNANGQPQGGDLGDWAIQTQGGTIGDSFGGNYTGVASLVSTTDIQEMNVIGWQLLTSPTVLQAETLYADNPISNFGLSIVDRATNVSNGFDVLASLTTLGAVRSVQLTDLVPAITLNSTQVSNDAILFPIIHGSYTLSVALSGPTPSIIFRLPSNVVDFTLTGSGSATLTANSTNDMFILDATGNHTIQAGGLGNYTIEGNAGSTTLDYSANATNVIANLVTDTVTKGLTFLGNPLEDIPPVFSRDTFTNVSAFIGSEAGGNTFKSIGTGGYTFGGLGANNTLDYSADTNAVTIHLSPGGAGTVVKDLLVYGDPLTGSPPQFWQDGFVNIQSFIGNASANDTVIFEGASNQYTIVNNPDGSVSVIDSVAGRDGSVQLDDISNLQFINKTITEAVTSTIQLVTAQQAVVASEVVAASTLFSIANPKGDSITQYSFEDSGGGSGHFTLAGTVEPNGQVFTVSASNLNSVQYVGGSSGGIDTLTFDAYDATTGASLPSVSVTATTWASGTPAIVNQEIDGLYVGLYGVAATGPGIQFWINATNTFDPSFMTANATTTAISEADATFLGQQFVQTQSTYFTSLYGNDTDTQFVSALYQNLSNSSGSPAGVAYWAGVLSAAEAANGGNVLAARAGLAGQFVHDLMSDNLAVGAAALGLTTAEYAALVAGQQTMLNKAEVAQYWAAESSSPGGGILNYTTESSPAFAAAEKVLMGVTSDPTTVTVAITGISNAVALSLA